MNRLTSNRKGFESPYKFTYEHGWELKNTGHNYSEDLMKNSFSSYMFKNERLSTFINEYLGPIMIFFINKVKYLRVFYNFAVPKNYQKIN